MTVLRHGVLSRVADWWHGWRDGRNAVPVLRRGRISTPHRDVLVRQAREGFERERLRFEASSAEATELAVAARERLRDVQQRFEHAQAEVDRVEPRPTLEDLKTRRPGEERRPPVVVARRRANEHRRRRAALVARLDALAVERALRAGELAAAEQAAARDREMAASRVRRIHEHTHARLAAYRRRLVRSHPDGSRIDWRLDILVPHRPAWTNPPPEPDDVEEPPSTADSARCVALLDVMTIGSAPEVEITIAGQRIADRQARLTRHGDEFVLEDLTLDGPVFVDGSRVRRAWLTVGDVFMIGYWRLRIESAVELSYAALHPPSLVVWQLSAVSNAGSRQEKVRLDKMSFSQDEATLLAILGPSGAGKSSLFSALLGELATSEGGNLYYGCLDLRTHGDQIRSMIGFVPQDDSLHITLRVQNLLEYSDRLRTPHLRASRRDRIAKVCDELKIEPNRRLQRVRELSGGQRKRVSIALELLADPQLLMLDEPTSGLDAGMDSEVMLILRRMAEEPLDDEQQRTVVVVTHSTDNLNQAHAVLLLAPDGRPVYFGEPGRIPGRFQRRNWADLMRTLVQDPMTTAGWVEDYQAGPAADAARQAAAAIEHDAVPPSRRVSRRGFSRWWGQFLVLMSRQWALLLTREKVFDAQGVRAACKGALAVLSPVLISLVGAVAAGLVTHDDPWNDPKAAPTALNLLVTLAMLAGQALTYSDIVAEFKVIHREHRTGVLVSAVVSAKWVVFAVLAIVQAAVMTGVFVAIRGAPPTSVVLPGGVELFTNLAVLSVAAMSSGILISVLASELSVAVGIATAAAIAQVAFNGWTADLTANGLLDGFSWILPARWGFAANAATIDLRHVVPLAVPDDLWTHTAERWQSDLVGMAVLTVGYVGAAVVCLHRRLRPDR